MLKHPLIRLQRTMGTPLFIAALEGHQQMMHPLIDAKAAVDQARTDNRCTPLFKAAREGHQQVVHSLIDAKAAVDQATTNDGCTPLFIAALEGHQQVVQLLIDAEAAVDQATTNDGSTSLFVAAEQGHQEVVQLLIDAKAAVDQATTNDGCTPLYIAALGGHQQVVQLLVDAKAAVDQATTDDGCTPLFIAACKEHQQVVQLLIDAKAAVDQATTDDGCTPLFIAACKEHQQVVQLLIDAKAAVDQAETYSGCTPLFKAAQHGHQQVAQSLIVAKAIVDQTPRDSGHTPLLMAVFAGHQKVVQLLIDAKAAVDQATTNDGCTPLFAAVLHGHKQMAQLLIDAKAAVDQARTDDGSTPILPAALGGHQQITQLLIDAKAAIDQARTDNGCTPLFIAAARGHQEVVQLLIDAKAAVDQARTDNGCTPLFIAALGGHQQVVQLLIDAEAAVDQATTNNGSASLFIAAEQGHEEVVQLLIDAKAAVDQARTDDGCTPLFKAAQHGHHQVVQSLIVAKAAVDQAKMDTGCTSLFIAAQQGHQQVVHSLIDAKAAVDQAKTDTGSTPLFVAAQQGHQQVVQLLIDAKAAVDQAMTHNGRTPLFKASQKGHQQVMQLLIDAKAAVDQATTDTGHTPLFIAVRKGLTEVVKLLLDAKAYPDFIKNDEAEGRTLAQYAEHRGHGDIYQLITRAKAAFEPVEKILVDRSTLYDFLFNLEMLKFEKSHLSGQQHRNRRKKVGAKLKKLAGQLKCVQQVAQLRWSGAKHQEKWQAWFESVQEKAVSDAKRTHCQELDQESVQTANKDVRKKLTPKEGVDPRQGADVQSGHVRKTYQFRCSENAVKVNLRTNKNPINATKLAATTVFHEQEPARATKAQIAAKRKKMAEDATRAKMKEKEAAAARAREHAREAAREKALKLQRETQIAELRNWLEECRCDRFLDSLVGLGLMTKDAMKRELASLTASELWARVCSIDDAFLISEKEKRNFAEEKWNFAVAVNSLLPDKAIRFSESEMEGWDDIQVHRWLKVIGFPYSLDLSGEDLVEATQETLKLSCKRIIRHLGLVKISWHELANRVTRCRDKALGFSPEDMRVGKLSWNKHHVLGTSNSTVYKGKYKHALGSRDCAVKRIVPNGNLTEQDRCLREIQHLEELQKSEYVIEYYHHEESIENDTFYLAMELADGGTLRQRANDNLLGGWEDRKCFCWQLCKGLLHLHQMSVVHRDLKPDNILLASAKATRDMGGISLSNSNSNDSGNVGGNSKNAHHDYCTDDAGGSIGRTSKQWVLKIADFGLARRIKMSQSRVTVTHGGAGTETWIPPEGYAAAPANSHGQTGQKRSETFSYDVHPCGSLLYYILSGGTHAFAGKNCREMEDNLRQGRHRMKMVFKDRAQRRRTSKEVFERGQRADRCEGMDLIESMLNKDPSARPPMGLVIKHPFFMTPSEKLNIIKEGSREGREKWSWLEKSELLRCSNVGDDWRKIPKLKSMKKLVRNEGAHYGRELKELARFVRNVHEHMYENPKLCRIFGLSAAKNETTDAKVVRYFGAIEPSMFLQLLSGVENSNNG